MSCLQSCLAIGTVVFSITKYSLSPRHIPGKGTPQKTYGLGSGAPSPPPCRHAGRVQAHLRTGAEASRGEPASTHSPGADPEGMEQDESPSLGELSSL